MMNSRMIAGVLLVLYLAGLTACTNRSTPADPAHLDQTDPPTCNAVCVTLTDTKIESSRVTFTAGEPYYFVVTNEGKAPGNFIITAEPQGPNPRESIRLDSLHQQYDPAEGQQEYHLRISHHSSARCCRIRDHSC
jgi:hypothetical protein